MAGTKPYLLRALYEWCIDNNQTPHVVAWVNQHTRVPMQYVRDNEIVLNVGPTACQDLMIDNDWVSFSARFAGVAQDIWIPVGHVISLFARESGEGMGFEVEPYEPADDRPSEKNDAQSDSVKTGSESASEEKPKKKTLKFVK